VSVSLCVCACSTRKQLHTSAPKSVEIHVVHCWLSACTDPEVNTQGDSDVISVPAGFRRHLVAKTLRNVFHCDIAEIRFVGKLVIIQTFS